MLCISQLKLLCFSFFQNYFIDNEEAPYLTNTPRVNQVHPKEDIPPTSASNTPEIDIENQNIDEKSSASSYPSYSSLSEKRSNDIDEHSDLESLSQETNTLSDLESGPIGTRTDSSLEDKEQDIASSEDDSESDEQSSASNSL